MAKKLHSTKWEMQIKATMSYHPHTINAEERVKRKEPSYTVAGNVNRTATMENNVEFQKT